MAIKVGVVGAAGFAGAELVRILIGHPHFDLRAITSDSAAGTPLSDMYPAFAGASDLAFEAHGIEAFEGCEAVFLAVPHTAALALAPQLLERGISVFDLSADYRLKDAATYEKWYGAKHTSPDELAKAAFGLPEITGSEIDQAAQRRSQGLPVLVACAGCYPTATSLAAYPAVAAGLVKAPVIVDAISGVTGAGKKATERTHFCFANEAVEAYGVAAHRHTPEIEQILGLPGNIVFTPHLAPLNRGLLSTVNMMVADDVRAGFALEALHERYLDFYSGREFVCVLPLGKQPKTSSVAGTNRCHIGLAYNEEAGVLIATGAIDNLCKGAAGQAVQCANIVFGFDEASGLVGTALPV